MKQRSLIFASGLLLVAVCTVAPQEAGVPDLVKSSVSAVVLIRVSDSSGKEQAVGSGFIVSSDGKIVTNYHVIKGGRSATAELDNGGSFQVEGIISSDEKMDLAVLKVKGKNLPFLRLGDSDRVQVGEHVVAIGSPLGLEASVSDGIISALRSGEAGESWLQTTAPVSHGNSGGPLIGMNGDVLGVITLSVDPSKAQNLNFALPINLVKPLLALDTSPTPLGVAGGPKPSERVWTSLASGKDFKLRFDGDYLYVQWVNLPAQLQATAAFSGAELRRSGNNWVGRFRSYLPCQYRDRWDWVEKWKTRWVTTETDIEITAVTGSRIEGRSQGYPGGLDCKKGQPKGPLEWASFTWIPKN